MKQLNRQLIIVYYSIYVAAILVVFLSYYVLKIGWQINPQSELGIYISQVFYLLLIISIPLTLATFNKKVKKWALLEDVNEKLRLYKKAAFIRLLIIGSGFLLGLIFYMSMRTNSMLFAAAISAVILLFCKPTEVKLITDLQLEEFD